MSYNTKYREIRCTFYSVSSKENILQNYSTISQPVCWHRYSQDREHPHHQETLILPIYNLAYFSPPLTTEHLVTIDLLSIFIILPFRECCISRIIKSNLLEVALLFSPSGFLWRLIQGLKTYVYTKNTHGCLWKIYH